MKAFSALRVRLREAKDCPGRGPQGEKHVIVCGDSDAVVMALMLDPRADVTINLGASYGLLHVKELQRRWLLQPLRQAGIDLGKDHQTTSGYTQVRAVGTSLLHTVKSVQPLTTVLIRRCFALLYTSERRFVQDFALLTIMQSGNDYLPSQALNVVRGPNARGTYLEMRATARWRHRTLLVVDRHRRIAGAPRMNTAVHV